MRVLVDSRTFYQYDAVFRFYIHLNEKISHVYLSLLLQIKIQPHGHRDVNIILNWLDSSDRHKSQNKPREFNSSWYKHDKGHVRCFRKCGLNTHIVLRISYLVSTYFNELTNLFDSNNLVLMELKVLFGKRKNMKSKFMPVYCILRIIRDIRFLSYPLKLSFLFVW